MDNTVERFLTNNRVSVFSVVQSNGTAHSATLHYAHEKGTVNIILMTEKGSRKMSSLIYEKKLNASIVIGFNEEDFITFQAEGSIEIVPDEKREQYWNMYLEKFPTRVERKTNPDFVLLLFTPSWWRYRDYKANPMKEISSEQ